MIIEELETSRASLPTLVTEDDPPTRQAETRLDERRDRGVLVQMSGAEAGRVFSLGAATCTLGRGRACVLRFDDGSLSRVHAGILRAGSRYVIEDCGSLNGTWVNDVRVRRKELDDGDRIRLAAGASLRFQMVSEAEEATMRSVYASSAFDALTGVHNRKQLEERLSGEVAYAIRHRTMLSIVMIDLDHFKQINDTRGHLAGDEVLRKAAQLFSAMIRTEDIIARYGGEEFVIVARGIPLANAANMAERLRMGIASAEITFGGSVVGVTASAGVASLACCAKAGGSVGTLMACADARLYRAKELGRNRVFAGL